MKNNYYSISEVSKLSNVSSRTLRYYDQINLLKPAKVNNNGYRLYGQQQLDLLEQIIYFKHLEFSLNKIKEIIYTPEFNIIKSLKIQREIIESNLQKEKDLLIIINNSIINYERKIQMTNENKFESLKENLINKNEELYEKEAQKYYGEFEYISVKNIIKKMPKSQYDDLKKTENKIFDELDLIKSKELNLDCDTAKSVFLNHQKWLKNFNHDYTKKYHLSIANMYDSDERFKKYYNLNTKTNAADVLIKIIKKYSK